MNKPPSKSKKATSAAFNNSEVPPDFASKDISLQENPALATIKVTAIEIPELGVELAKLSPSAILTV